MSEWWDQGEQWQAPRHVTVPAGTTGRLRLQLTGAPEWLAAVGATPPPRPILYLRCTNCGHTESGTDHDAAVERSNAHVSACRA